jgi:hypothetical protein
VVDDQNRTRTRPLGDQAKRLEEGIEHVEHLLVKG